MDATGVFRHIAADRAGDLAARVRRVVKAVGRCGFADSEVAYAALNERGPAASVNFDDAVEHLRQQMSGKLASCESARESGASHLVTGLAVLVDDEIPAFEWREAAGRHTVTAAISFITHATRSN